jgi:hypothetical protein
MNAVNRQNAAVAKVWMQDASVARWWFAEVVREDVANDNVDAAEWANQWSRVADAWADRPAFAAVRRNVMEQVAMVRAANRPQAVR